MKIQPKYIQLFSDALIPILGFFLWNWSLYFILLFYFIDFITDEVILHLKSKKIIQSQNVSNSIWWKHGIVSFTVFTLLLLIIHFAMVFIDDGINFWTEAVAFWNYEELGIKQGVLFIPLVFLVGYMQFRMEFLLPARYKTADLSILWRKHIAALLSMIALAGLCLALEQFISIPELFYVLAIVLLSSLYKLRFN
ncbi:MAG: hypothetical protein ACPGVI_02680 [Crocinitomicaceae bacterium]